MRGKDHRGAANELALPFAHAGLTTKVRADILVQVAEPPRRDAPAIGPSAKACFRPQVRRERDPTMYSAGVKISGDKRATVNVVRHDFHGKCKYTISPKSKALWQQFAADAYVMFKAAM